MDLNLQKGPYKRVLKKVRNIAARPVFQKWDNEDMFLTYYRPRKGV